MHFSFTDLKILSSLLGSHFREGKNLALLVDIYSFQHV